MFCGVDPQLDVWWCWLLTWMSEGADSSPGCLIVLTPQSDVLKCWLPSLMSDGADSPAGCLLFLTPQLDVLWCWLPSWMSDSADSSAGCLIVLTSQLYVWWCWLLSWRSDGDDSPSCPHHHMSTGPGCLIGLLPGSVFLLLCTVLISTEKYCTIEYFTVLKSTVTSSSTSL